MIVTFFSIKGGTGRSMALVNIGEVFAQAGLRVLLVDFDLEAPSLEMFYPDKTQTILDSRGVVDLITSYKHAIATPGSLYQTADSPSPFEDIRSLMVNVRNEVSGGTVDLIPVGRRSADSMSQYANVVRTFDWKDFYEKWEGELYFRWLRQQFDEHADVTLVDCRTGITDAGGVCCGQVADVVVLLTTMNLQQISGSDMMVSKLRDAWLAELRATSLKLIVVPSRIEFNELALLDEFKEKFVTLFGKSIPEEITSDDLWNSAIPYDPRYRYGTYIVRQDLGSDPLKHSYTRIAELLSRLAPPDSPFFKTGIKLNAPIK